MHNLHPEVFRLYNDVNTKNPDRKTIHDLLFWKQKIPKEEQEILQNIINQFNDIYKLLKPMMKLGITFDLWLVGGSVRDLLLGNGSKISDLDIMLTFNRSVMPRIPTANSFIKKIKLDINNEQLKPLIYRTDPTIPFLHWKDLNKVSKKDWKINQARNKLKPLALFDMLACCLSKELDLYEIYKPADKTKDIELCQRYVDSRIDGVIKMKKDGWKWPVDIIVTQYIATDFIEAFDFNICKVAMELHRGSDIREQRKINKLNPGDLLKRVKLTNGFLTDFKNKQLNMSVGQMMTMRQVQHSVEKHLPKLEAKYPWPVNVKVDEVEQFGGFAPPAPGEPEPKIPEDIRVTYLESFFLARQLQKNLEEKEFQHKKKPNKI